MKDGYVPREYSSPPPYFLNLLKLGATDRTFLCNFGNYGQIKTQREVLIHVPTDPLL